AVVPEPVAGAVPHVGDEPGEVPAGLGFQIGPWHALDQHLDARPDRRPDAEVHAVAGHLGPDRVAADVVGRPHRYSRSAAYAVRTKRATGNTPSASATGSRPPDFSTSP